MKELTQILWQMTDMVVDYTFEPFGVPDLHPRSQEHYPKSGRVSNFLNLIVYKLQWLEVLDTTSAPPLHHLYIWFGKMSMLNFFYKQLLLTVVDKFTGT